MKGRLIGLLVFLAICSVLAFGSVAQASEHYTYSYTCQFLGYCPEGGQKTYIPAVECGRKC